MSLNKQKENVKKSESAVNNTPSDGLGLITASEPASRGTERSGSSGLKDDKTNPSSLARKSVGPRMSAEKQKRKYNALKSGIFAKDVLLKGESSAEYTSLVKDLRKDLQPQGVSEIALVEILAAIIWRMGRYLRAERAEIAMAAEFKSFEFTETQEFEAWDHSRAGETSGGMLRHSSNPFVIREAIEALRTFRNSLEKYGFLKVENPWFLKKLYGLDHDNAAPLGISRMYHICAKIAADVPKQGESPLSIDELKKEMVGMFDEEINRLELLEALQLSIDRKKGEYQIVAALVPSRAVMERLIRYETHLSREFDRTLSQLERLQRIRLGQPAPPTVRVSLS